MSVGPTNGVGGTNSTSRDEPTYPFGLIDEFSGHIKNSLRSGPTDTTKLPHYAFNEHSSTQLDAGGPSSEVKVPPPTDMVPLGGRLLRGARGGPIFTLMQATRYIEFGVDGVDGRPDLSARRIQDGLDGFWGSDRLDIFDASKRQLTSLPLEKADKGLNIKDANGHIVGHLGLTQDNPPKIMAKISPEVLKQFPLPPTTDAPQQPETVGSDPTVKPDANPKAPTEQKSYGFVTKTQEEADLVTSMMAQGKSQNEIQTALDDLQSKRGRGQDANPKGGAFKGNWDDLTIDERAFVTREVNAGRNIESVPTGKDRTPDFNIDGVVFELKTISSVENITSDGLSGAIASRVMDGRGQAPNIVVDMTNQSGITKEIAERGIRRAYGADNRLGGAIQGIRVVGPDFDITVSRKK